jgi:hypothetical protein
LEEKIYCESGGKSKNKIEKKCFEN